MRVTPRSNRQGQREQEKTCAQAFVDWLSCQRGNSYDLERAENCPELSGRWDFVARERETTRWLALEVKGLVVAQSHRQFGSWSKFCERLTEYLQAHQSVRGYFTLNPAIPWTFDQRQGNTMVRALAEALPDVTAHMVVDEEKNLGSVMKAGFADWPTKSPRSDPVLWREQGIYKIVHPPEDLLLWKHGDEGCSVEVGFSMGEVFEVSPAIEEAVLGIFDPEGGRGAKPNEQLREARLKGASETFLLLDSQIAWGPQVVVDTLSNVDRNLLSNIDSVYLVSASHDRIEKVWPNE